MSLHARLLISAKHVVVLAKELPVEDSCAQVEHPGRCPPALASWTPRPNHDRLRPRCDNG
jgi:hypothetical protein